MSEWDPRNPESLTVRYDLADWSLEERVELVELLADADIRHDWDGNELLVPADRESVVDDILDDVDVVYVADAHMGYFAAIGAVGPKADQI